MSSELKAQMTSKYLEFLKKLWAAGENLPAAMPEFVSGYNHFRAGIVDFNEGHQLLFPSVVTTTPATLKLGDDKAIELTAEVLTAEREVLTLLQKRPMGMNEEKFGKLKALGDGTLLRALFAFLQANPWLLDILFKLLTPPTPSVQV